MERALPVGEGVAKCIEAYLPHRHNYLEKKGSVGEEALFVNNAGRRFREEGVTNYIKRIAKKAGLEHITTQRFRHTCATDLLEAGVTVAEVKQMMGHAVLDTTLRYTQVADPARREAMEKHPINDFLREEE